ncbi:hypothetical protein GCM10009765_71530 [Fodinicola feengrottensis]|uniref:PIN domain-containing protein n=1 Tax=Fodinicola feengrottensis TaxID=435914 RepID=A0ABP4UU96_9ACTN
MSGYQHALLDTSVVIDFRPELVKRHADFGSISTITMAELASGLQSKDPLANAARQRRYQWADAAFDLIPYSRDAAHAYGALCALVRATGRNPRPRRFDLLIASVAMTSQLPLLTLNPADFSGLEKAVKVVDVSR